MKTAHDLLLDEQLPCRQNHPTLGGTFHARAISVLAGQILTVLMLVVVVGCGTGQSTNQGGKAGVGGRATGDTLEAKTDKRLADGSERIRFAEVTDQCDIDFVYRTGSEADHYSIVESLGGGVGLLDFDRDGWLDLFAVGGGGFEGERMFGHPSALFRALDEFQFEDVSAAAGNGLASAHYSHGCFAADYDDDGFTDILVTGYGGLQLWKNQGDGTFLESQAPAGLNDTSWSTAAGWADLNGDGFLDLYVAHYVNWSFDNNPFCKGPRPGLQEVCAPRIFRGLPDSVYFSNGDGTFRDVTPELDLQPEGKGLGVVLGDVDLDGDIDVYVGNDTTPNFLYLNDGSGNLTEVAELHGAAVDDTGTPNGSMGVDMGDYNGDGLPDLWAANFEVESFALYRNDGDAQFLYVSQVTGVTALNDLFVGFGTAFFDVDWDGDQDIVVSNGHVIRYPRSAPLLQLPLVLENHQQRRYRRWEFPEGSYLGTPHMGRGLALGDLDEDGDLDMAISHIGEPIAVLRNDSESSGSWFRVRLLGRDSNRDGLGAILELKLAGGRQLRMVKGGATYLSQHDLRVTFGVPAGEQIEELTVRWPSGRIQKLPPPALEQTVLITEPDAP